MVLDFRQSHNVQVKCTHLSCPHDHAFPLCLERPEGDVTLESVKTESEPWPLQRGHMHALSKTMPYLLANACFGVVPFVRQRKIIYIKTIFLKRDIVCFRLITCKQKTGRKIGQTMGKITRHGCLSCALKHAPSGIVLTNSLHSWKNNEVSVVGNCKIPVCGPSAFMLETTASAQLLLHHYIFVTPRAV